MFQLNGSFMACPQRLKKDDLSIGLQDTLHLAYPFFQFSAPCFLVPDDKISYAPARDNEINGMVLHRQLSMVSDIHLPVRQTTCNQPLAADPQHFGRGIERMNRFQALCQQESQAPRPCAEID